ncbi:MAG: hypothetical protein ACRDHP_06255, partial [Ktedonobacterales bacterium]
MPTRNVKRTLILGVTCLAIAGTVGASLVLHQGAVSHASAGGGQSSTTQNLTSIGTGQIIAGQSNGAGANSLTDQTAPEHEHDFNMQAKAPATVPTAPANPTPSSTASNNSGLDGFAGLNHVDSRSASNGNQYSLEPPDQGLCVGNGYVVEAVNDVMAVYSASGSHAIASGPTALNAFFGLPYMLDRTKNPPVPGPFLSDPKCVYDAAGGHFVLTVLQELNAQNRAYTLIAVSQTNDPNGKWDLYSIDATDDGQNGTPSHAGCPCFGDQPLIGFNANGFYISTNEFGAGFNGAQLYAMSLSGLESGALPKVVHLDLGALPTHDAGGIWYSVQPAVAPPGAPSGQGQDKNTEFFMSSLQFGPAPLDNRIAVWSLNNTQALVSGNPQAVKISNTVISSETYGSAPDGSMTATQKPGPTPLGTAVGAPENLLNANDDRMNQVVYANGMLYSGVNTYLQGGRIGIAYFIVSPSIQGHTVSASMANQGYVSLANDNVMFPSIAVNNAGQGIISFSFSGPDYYPSTGYATIDATNGAGAIHTSSSGVAPADGFTGYPAYGGNGVERWGDYSAAVVAEDGSFW